MNAKLFSIYIYLQNKDTYIHTHVIYMHAEQGSGCNKLDYTQLRKHSYTTQIHAHIHTYIHKTHTYTCTQSKGVGATNLITHNF
jgi:hypothetical protein